MLKPQGYAIAVDPSGKSVLECDTFTCNHCNSIVFMKDAKTDPDSVGGFCRLCMKNICKHCLDKTCIPFERKLLAMEARGRLHKAVGV